MYSETRSLIEFPQSNDFKPFKEKYDCVISDINNKNSVSKKSNSFIDKKIYYLLYALLFMIIIYIYRSIFYQYDFDITYARNMY